MESYENLDANKSGDIDLPKLRFPSSILRAELQREDLPEELLLAP